MTDALTVDDNLRRIAAANADKLATQPERAVVRYRAGGTCGEGVRSEITIRDHHMVVDEPPAVGGRNAAPGPPETALAALLGCIVVTYRLWAAKLEIPLDTITVEAEGDLDVRGFFGIDDSVRAGFGAVRVRVALDGPAGEQRYRELQEAADAHCPVLDLFRGATPVTTELVTAGQDGGRE
ncbi:MAG: OsmC family protein [Pseudonocardia sp.]